ncbi:MAG: hypothetical protein M1812_003573 [Candelaria pacifica]|nr:MAG: hypothetical protein M1812_003573 [Candelaria pacifica]
MAGISKNSLFFLAPVANSVNGEEIFKLLETVLPSHIPPSQAQLAPPHQPYQPETPTEFIQDVKDRMNKAPMSIRITPHILSCINWSDPLNDPIRMQFIPMMFSYLPDHPKLGLDSLNERSDSPIKGLVHRYPEKVLFLATSVCNVYCSYCTRAYSVGPETRLIMKDPNKPGKSRWEHMFKYIETTPEIKDVTVSGGDCYQILPENIKLIGERLLSIPHIRSIRFGTRGLAVMPSRTLDQTDTWTDELINLSNLAMTFEETKTVALHTHFMHSNEITWVTRQAARRLRENGVTVRNQTVLLKDVNNNVTVMRKLLEGLKDLHIQPYYIYQCDMVKGIEDRRTPLSEILNMEEQLLGTGAAGYDLPKFVVDLPGGGGKRPASTRKCYDPSTGVSVFTAPAVKGDKKEFRYFDPLWACGEGGDGGD